MEQAKKKRFVNSWILCSGWSMFWNFTRIIGFYPFEVHVPKFPSLAGKQYQLVSNLHIGIRAVSFGKEINCQVSSC